jgi:hypothetical protein
MHGDQPCSSAASKQDSAQGIRTTYVCTYSKYRYDFVLLITGNALTMKHQAMSVRGPKLTAESFRTHSALHHARKKSLMYRLNGLARRCTGSLSASYPYPNCNGTQFVKA